MASEREYLPPKSVHGGGPRNADAQTGQAEPTRRIPLRGAGHRPGRLVIFGGGYPLQKDGEVVGAIASSGSQVTEDRQVAEAGVAKFKQLIG